jgi:predicted RNA-binding Zn ribbon-like protein
VKTRGGNFYLRCLSKNIKFKKRDGDRIKKIQDENSECVSKFYSGLNTGELGRSETRSPIEADADFTFRSTELLRDIRVALYMVCNDL